MSKKDYRELENRREVMSLAAKVLAFLQLEPAPSSVTAEQRQTMLSQLQYLLEHPETAQKAEWPALADTIKDVVRQMEAAE